MITVVVPCHEDGASTSSKCRLPIKMGVGVDKARGDNLPLGVDFNFAGANIAADGDNDAAGNGNIADKRCRAGAIPTMVPPRITRSCIRSLQ